MNKRIKLLAEQAKTYVDAKWAKEGSPVYPEAHYLFLQQRDEKFAELIVQECANHCDLLLDHKISPEWSRGTHDCSRAIKKHFGVEGEI